jgi:putative DNA primase/helicase
MSKGINPGLEKGYEAAQAVNGYIITPTFARGEQDQNPKKFSDFNDLAHHSILGREGVKRQVRPVVDKLKSRNRYLRSLQSSISKTKILKENSLS